MKAKLKENARLLIGWFGEKKTSKLLGITRYKLKTLVKTTRQPNKRKARKRQSINPTLSETHTADFGRLALKSLFEANKHSRKPLGITLGIMRNVKTNKIIWELSNRIENSDIMRDLILSAQLKGENIEVLRIDNQAYIKPLYDLNIKPKIKPKCNSEPYNTLAEQTISRIQTTLQRNRDKLGDFDKWEIVKALCYAQFDNNPTPLLKILRSAEIKTEESLICVVRHNI